MTAIAKARYQRVSPKKVKIVADLVRGLNVEQALNILKYSQKGVARALEKTIRSAVANAVNLAPSKSKVDTGNLFIEKIDVGPGPTMRRFQPRAMGRASRIRKRTSHITVTLGDGSTD